MKLNDPICSACPNKFIKYKDKKIPCPHLCLPLQWVNGNKARKEPLFEDIKKKPPASRDYNITLSELIDDKQTALERISEIPGIKKRAIASMLIVNISRQDVADLLSMSYKQITRIINNHK